LILDGTMDDQKVHLQMQSLDHNKLRLVSRGFHWVQERPFNRRGQALVLRFEFLQHLCPVLVAGIQLDRFGVVLDSEIFLSRLHIRLA
jgi:hypothetical protein